MKILLSTLALLLSLSQAQLFTGPQNCVACLGSKRIICAGFANGSGCFDSLSACPQAQWRTNIFTTCTAIQPAGIVAQSNNT